MVSLGILTVLGAALIVNSALARPRAPQSPRFPQSSDNFVGEFVLWSCTATAELQKNNVNKNIIHIATAPGELPGTGFRIPSALPSREEDDRINNINIIKLNTIPHQNRGRPGTVPQKTNNSQSSGANDQGTKHEDVGIHVLDSPLKTIKVNSFRKDVPLLFREKPQLPQLENRPVKEDGSGEHSSEITVIKP